MQIRRLTVWIRLPNGADRLDATQTRLAAPPPMPRKYKFPTCQRTSPRLHPPLPLPPDASASAPRHDRLCPQTRLRLLPRSLREIDHETATIDADFQDPFNQLPATFLLISWKRGLLSKRFVHRDKKTKRFTLHG